MNAVPITADLGEGKTFVSTGDPIVGDLPPLPEWKDASGKCTNDNIVRWASQLWARTYEQRQPELARLKMAELAYRGMHYRDISLNRTLEVTNFVYSNVETAASILCSQPLRPQIMPSQAMSWDKVKKLREFGRWWMQRSGFDEVRETCTRTGAKHGYFVVIMTMDPRTGMPFARDWSVYDWYPDYSARNLWTAEYHILAAPIATRRLKAMYPEMAEHIKPDNYVSPSYDVLVDPDKQFYQPWMGRSKSQQSITNQESTGQYQSTPQPTGSSAMNPSQSQSPGPLGAETTWFSQILVRDHGKQEIRYPGEVHESGIDPYPYYHKQETPCCESGWRMVNIASGKVLDQFPIDACWGGLPILVGYHGKHEGRLQGSGGEPDQILPMNRSYNERKNQLNRSLRLASAPVLVSTKGSGINFNSRTVEAGDVLEPIRGSDISWLEYRGPDAAQFNHLGTEKEDMELVGGIHRALMGFKPEGIEAGVAIESLQDASATRLKAKMPHYNRVWAAVLLMALKAMRAKLSVPITFYATGGQQMTITKQDLEGEFEFYFGPDARDLDVEQKREDKALTLFQMGLITPMDALEMANIPDYQKLGTNMQNLMLAQAQASAAAAAATEGKPGEAKGQKNGTPARR